MLRPHGDYAIIGPGRRRGRFARGRQRQSRASPESKSIPSSPTPIMRGRYADYSYHLYQRPESRIFTSRTVGRSSATRTSNFDVVQMTLVDTWASTAARAPSRSAKTALYTVDAFREYFRTSQAGRDDRHHALGVPAAARGPARSFGRKPKRFTRWASPIRRSISSSCPTANSMKTEFPWLCWRKKSPFTADEESVQGAPRGTRGSRPSCAHLPR